MGEDHRSHFCNNTKKTYISTGHQKIIQKMALRVGSSMLLRSMRPSRASLISKRAHLRLPMASTIKMLVSNKLMFHHSQDLSVFCLTTYQHWQSLLLVLSL